MSSTKITGPIFFLRTQIHISMLHAYGQTFRLWETPYPFSKDSAAAYTPSTSVHCEFFLDFRRGAADNSSVLCLTCSIFLWLINFQVSVAFMFARSEFMRFLLLCMLQDNLYGNYCSTEIDLQENIQNVNFILSPCMLLYSIFITNSCTY